MNLLRRLLPNIDAHAPRRRPRQERPRRRHRRAGPRIVHRACGSASRSPKSLAYVLGKPIVGIGTLDAMAHGVAPAGRRPRLPDDLRAGRRGLLVAFRLNGNRLTDYAVSPIDDVLNALASRRIDACTLPAPARAKLGRDSRAYGRSGDARACLVDFARGAALIELGAKRLAAGDDDNAMTLSPALRPQANAGRPAGSRRLLIADRNSESSKGSSLCTLSFPLI